MPGLQGSDVTVTLLVLMLLQTLIEAVY